MKNEERAIFRVRYEQLKQFLLNFRANPSPPSLDLIRVGEIFGLMESVDGSLRLDSSLRLTDKGRDMLLAYENDQKENEKNLLRTTFHQNQQLRLHWALVCDGRDSFKTSELTSIFREMGYDELADNSLGQYIRAFVDWAESAGMCGKGGLKGHTYTIVDRIIIGMSEKGEIGESLPTVAIQATTDPESAMHFNILSLNAHICDYLADPSHEGDLKVIKTVMEKLRGNGFIDGLIIDMLEREINIAMETKSKSNLAAVAQSLKDIREKYVEKR